MDWFYHVQWLELYPKLNQTESDLKAFMEIGSIPKLRNALLNSLHPADDHAKALAIYLSLYQAHPEHFTAYHSLAAAYAIVFDQPFHRDWPHHQVSRAALPVGDTDVGTRFEYYVNANEARDLEYDLRKLPPHLLKHVVDSIVEISELTWVKAETKFKLRNIDEAFNSISYDFSRVNGAAQYHWPYEKYRLSDIRSRKGICVDQAYFGVMVGKALGIPTLYFSGQGSGGGHAWMGYLKDEDQWNTDVGRYESQNYPVGHARDPQTGQVINDAQLAQLSEGMESKPAFIHARQIFLLAQHLSNEPEYLSILQTARDVLPELIEPWIAEAQLLQHQQNLPALKRHLEKWIEVFDDQVDYKVAAQTMLLEILKAEGSPEAKSLQKTIIRQNRKKRFDLGIDSGAGSILEKIDAEDWDAAEKEFKQLIRRFDDQGGGNLFYYLVRPYVQSCYEAGQIEHAQKGLKYAYRKMAPERGSILDEEFGQLNSQLNLDSL